MKEYYSINKTFLTQCKKIVLSIPGVKEHLIIFHHLPRMRSCYKDVMRFKEFL